MDSAENTRRDIFLRFCEQSADFMRKALLLILLSGFVVTGCAIRRAPPVRYVPLLGAKKDTSMEAVLERALEDKNPIVRLDAVRLLGTMTDPELQERAASALGRALKDPDENTRFEAVKSLSNFSADIAGPYLMKAMDDDSVRIRIQSCSSAATALPVADQPGSGGD